MVTAAETARAPAGHLGLLGKLMAAVRPEFRAGILVPERGALVFDVAPCRVPGCPTTAHPRFVHRPLHSVGGTGPPGHRGVRRHRGPGGLGRKELTVCVVPGCRYGGARLGFAPRHQGFWERAGIAGPGSMAGRPGTRRRPRSSCLRVVLLHAMDPGDARRSALNHRSRGKRGRPDIEEFIALCESYGDDRFDFRALLAAPAEIGDAVRAAVPPR